MEWGEKQQNPPSTLSLCIRRYISISEQTQPQMRVAWSTSLLRQLMKDPPNAFDEAEDADWCMHLQWAQPGNPSGAGKRKTLAWSTPSQRLLEQYQRKPGVDQTLHQGSAPRACP